MTTIRYLIVLLTFCACGDFYDPNELGKTQILGIRSVPPIVRPGHSAELSVLIVDSQGTIALTSENVTWNVTNSPPLIKQPLGTITTINDDGSAVYQAPDNIGTAEDPSIATIIEVSITLPNDLTLTALKTILFAPVDDNENPVITRLVIGDTDIDMPSLKIENPIELSKHENTPLEAFVDDHIPQQIDAFLETLPEALCPTKHAPDFAWYTNVGSIDFFRTPMPMFIPPDPETIAERDNNNRPSTQGHLYLVYRVVYCNLFSSLTWTEIPITLHE